MLYRPLLGISYMQLVLPHIIIMTFFNACKGDSPMWLLSK